MYDSLFNKLAQDLFTLEINTIIKSDMSAVKMPISRRQALYVLAEEYSRKLMDIKVRDPVYWKYGGMRSYGELRDRAKEGIEKLEKEFIKAPPDKQKEIQENIAMLGRINYQSSQIVGIFKILEKDATDKKGYAKAPPRKDRETLLRTTKLEPAKSEPNSAIWNNDIDRSAINEIEDLDLTPHLFMHLRKAWEIGTENIILQTVIQIDGDVTTRMAERFAVNPNKTVLEIHNNSIGTSTHFWSNLVKTLGEISGKISGLFR